MCLFFSLSRTGHVFSRVQNRKKQQLTEKSRLGGSCSTKMRPELNGLVMIAVKEWISSQRVEVGDVLANKMMGAAKNGHTDRRTCNLPD